MASKKGRKSAPPTPGGAAPAHGTGGAPGPALQRRHPIYHGAVYGKTGPTPGEPVAGPGADGQSRSNCQSPPHPRRITDVTTAPEPPQMGEAGHPMVPRGAHPIPKREETHGEIHPIQDGAVAVHL